jgi:hypothetical protein
MSYAHWVPPLHDRDSHAAQNFAAIFDEMLGLLGALPADAAA